MAPGGARVGGGGAVEDPSACGGGVGGGGEDAAAAAGPMRPPPLGSKGGKGCRGLPFHPGPPQNACLAFAIPTSAGSFSGPRSSFLMGLDLVPEASGWKT